MSHATPFTTRGKQAKTQNPRPGQRLVSMESFTLDGKAAVTSHERYQNDEGGVWIWGNSALMNDEQKPSLQATVQARRLAFTCSMENLRVTAVPWGCFPSNLTPIKQ